MYILIHFIRNGCDIHHAPSKEKKKKKEERLIIEVLNYTR